MKPNIKLKTDTQITERRKILLTLIRDTELQIQIKRAYLVGNDGPQCQQPQWPG